MKRLNLGAATATLALIGGVASAQAQEWAGAWYVHAGPAQLSLANEATIRVGGIEQPGASYSSEAQTTTVVEIGRRLTDHLSASVTLGAPPTADAEASGSIAGIGQLGSATYGPMAATLQYRFNPYGVFQPYIGGGVSYMHIFDAKDGLMTNLDIEDAAGAVWQVGADYQVSDRWATFIDIKQAYLETKATGLFLGAPAEADMVFDPFVLNIGVGYNF